MIVDAKASNLKLCSAKCQCVILPILFGVVIRTLEMLGSCNDLDDVEWFVLDFSKVSLIKVFPNLLNLTSN